MILSGAHELQGRGLRDSTTSPLAQFPPLVLAQTILEQLGQILVVSDGADAVLVLIRRLVRVQVLVVDAAHGVVRLEVIHQYLVDDLLALRQVCRSLFLSILLLGSAITLQHLRQVLRSPLLVETKRQLALLVPEAVQLGYVYLALRVLDEARREHLKVVCRLVQVAHNLGLEPEVLAQLIVVFVVVGDDALYTMVEHFDGVLHARQADLQLLLYDGLGVVTVVFVESVLAAVWAAIEELGPVGLTVAV